MIVTFLLYQSSSILAEDNLFPRIIIPDFLSSYSIASCSSNVVNTLSIEGNSKVQARNFSYSDALFSSPIISNASINLSGNAYVNSNAIVAPQHNVSINGNANLTGDIIIANDILDCSISNINELIEWIKINNQNELIPNTNKGRTSWGCSDNPLEWEFCLKQNESITLPSGIYWFTKWIQYNNSKIYVNGYVFILVTGEINIQDNANVNADNNPYNLLIYQIADQQQYYYEFNLSGNSKINALLYMPFSKINLSGNEIAVWLDYLMCNKTKTVLKAL